MNVIDLLKKHHQTVRDALDELERSDEIDVMELRLVADELVAHMMIEEQFFYPRVRELAGDLIMESFEEHAVARFELARVFLAKGEEQKARLKVLKEIVLQHVREEETQLLPKVQRSIPGRELESLGAKLEPIFESAVELGFDKLVVTDQRGPELRTIGQRQSPTQVKGRRQPKPKSAPKGLQRARGRGGRAHA